MNEEHLLHDEEYLELACEHLGIEVGDVMSACVYRDPRGHIDGAHIALVVRPGPKHKVPLDILDGMITVATPVEGEQGDEEAQEADTPEKDASPLLALPHIADADVAILNEAGIYTVADVADMSVKALAGAIDGVGAKRAKEIIAAAKQIAGEA